MENIKTDPTKYFMDPEGNRHFGLEGGRGHLEIAEGIINELGLGDIYIKSQKQARVFILYAGYILVDERQISDDSSKEYIMIGYCSRLTSQDTIEKLKSEYERTWNSNR